MKQNREKILKEARNFFEKVMNDDMGIYYDEDTPDDMFFEIEDVRYPVEIDKFTKVFIDERKIKMLRTMRETAKNNVVSLMKDIGLNPSYPIDDVISKPIQDKSGIDEIVLEAVERINQTLPYPGYSDHHTGLAIDIFYCDRGFKSFQWLLANARHFGFIWRYTQQSAPFTGIVPEDWHLRFVGIPHAEKMHELNMTLDEYIINGTYRNV
ncbi:MAG: D-alanyl-D-alanine carboxypeptidase family protein [Lactobacillales bacterium]|jgi:LAS superfamily LD-carboxypeptidase LdcB|nr:D-alanyl-D-alanine carboxypeptidase family protein [Lactobacillales bacterium]